MIFGLYSIARVSFRTLPPRSDVPIHILTLDHQFIRRLIALTHMYTVQIQFALGAMCENLPFYTTGWWWLKMTIGKLRKKLRSYPRASSQLCNTVNRCHANPAFGGTCRNQSAKQQLPIRFSPESPMFVLYYCIIVQYHHRLTYTCISELLHHHRPAQIQA